jgi:hypothetical protein
MDDIKAMFVLSIGGALVLAMLTLPKQGMDGFLKLIQELGVIPKRLVMALSGRLPDMSV